MYSLTLKGEENIRCDGKVFLEKCLKSYGFYNGILVASQTRDEILLYPNLPVNGEFLSQRPHRTTIECVEQCCFAQDLHSVAQNKVWNYMNHPLTNSTNTHKTETNHKPEPGRCQTFNSQIFRHFFKIVYTVNYIVTIQRMLMTWRRNERGHHLLLYWSF